MPDNRNHRLDYVEITVPDLPAAKAFYGQAFGWEFQDWGPDYASFQHGGRDGGLRPDAEGFTPATGNPLVIVYADDLAATEKAVRAAGGTIRERHEFPGGRRFHFADPFGNVLAAWTEA